MLGDELPRGNEAWVVFHQLRFYFIFGERKTGILTFANVIPMFDDRAINNGMLPSG